MKRRILPLLLFALVLLDWSGNRVPAPLAPDSPDETLASPKRFVPLTLRYRQQVLDQIQAPLLAAATPGCVGPVCSPSHSPAGAAEVGTPPLAAADRLVLLMSLQR